MEKYGDRTLCAVAFFAVQKLFIIVAIDFFSTL